MGVGGRYRIEPVFGSIKRADRSYIGCRRAEYALVRVGCSLVLWNRVQYLRVRGVDILGLEVGWCGFGGWRRNFRTPSATS